MKWEAHECHRDPWLCVSDIDSCHVNLMSQQYFSTRFLFKKHRFLERYTEYSEWKDISCGILFQDRGRFLFKNTAFLKDVQNFVNGKTLLVAYYYKIVAYYYNIVVQKTQQFSAKKSHDALRREKLLRGVRNILSRWSCVLVCVMHNETFLFHDIKCRSHYCTWSVDDRHYSCSILTGCCHVNHDPERWWFNFA